MHEERNERHRASKNTIRPVRHAGQSSARVSVPVAKGQGGVEQGDRGVKGERGTCMLHRDSDVCEDPRVEPKGSAMGWCAPGATRETFWGNQLEVCSLCQRVRLQQTPPKSHRPAGTREMR